MAEVRSDNKPGMAREQAARLAAYMPVTLAQRVLTTGLPTPGRPATLPAAALFSDISGFTAMSEELASDGPRGAEELNRVLLTTFTAMIDLIHSLGGAVSHFYGDAMSVYFPDGDGRAARRALTCAQMMQRLMHTSFNRVVTNRPPDKDPFFHLTIKIGVGYGECQELVVGDPATNLEFVLTGAAVDEAAAAEKRAASGQVMASQAVLARAGLPAPAPFAPLSQELEALAPLAPILNWEAVTEEGWQRLTAVAPAFVHRAVVQRLLAGSATSLAEHRPVTSLFVQFDFAGDEDDSSAIETAVMGQQLQQYYQWAGAMVARFGQTNARVNRVLTGDKGNQLHIIFGAPVAPDAPEQAIRCALALQREKPAFIARQRIGLAVGKVFAGPVGSAARQEYTVVGDVVNLSARLMQICTAGQVFTSAATAGRTRQWLEFKTLPAVQLKGKQIAVIPYVPLKERAAATQFQSFVTRWERPLVGREAELARLQAAMDRALAGEGQILAVVGATGAGKSHLLAAAVQHWVGHQGTGFLGVSYPHTAEMPYSLWRGVWDAFFGLSSGQSTAEQATAVVNRTRALLPDIGDEVGLWAEVLGLPIPQSEAVAGLTAEARQARLWALVRRCFRAQAAQQPLCIVLEDLHWADQASLLLLDDLANHLGERPWCLCLTLRRDVAIHLPAIERPDCVRVMIADLSPRAARQLLRQLVGVAALPPAVEMHLGLRDRDGRDSPVNPLFLEEAVRMLEGVGVLQRGRKADANGVQVNEARLAQVQVPDTIHGLLLARLDRLPAAERDLLQVASVIGRQFGVAPLTILSAQPSPRLIIEMLAQLSAAEMTRLVTAAPEWIYLFQHAMTHDVAYESLPYARRQLLHGLIGDWLVTAHQDNLRPHYPVLAYHYGRAGNHERGLHYALRAAHAARDIFANQEAVDLYTQAEKHVQALGAGEWWETAVEIRLGRANVLMSLGNLDLAQADATAALQVAVRHDALATEAEAYNLMAEICYRQGRLSEIPELTEQVLVRLRAVATPEQQIRAYIWAGWAASSQMATGSALQNLELAERLCLQENENFLLARVLEAKSYAHYLQRDLTRSLAAMERGVQLSRDFSTPLNLGTALNNVGFVQFMLGQYEKAVQTFDEAVAIGEESGRNLVVMALANRAAALCRLARFPEARHDFEAAIALLGEMNYPRLEVETYLFWGFEYHCALGEWEPARRQFQRAKAIIDGQPESYIEERARLLLGLGQVEVREGNLAQAAALLQEAGNLIEAKDLFWWRPAACYFLAEMELARGQVTAARAHLQAGLTAVAAGASPEYEPLIRERLAAIDEDET